jgi:hypothetical protein
VSYTGVSQRAVTSSLSADLGNIAKKLKLDQVDNNSGNYPASLALANDGKGITVDSSTTLAYTTSTTTNPSTFCLSATKSNQNYNITQDGIVAPGICPVLNLDAGSPTSYPGSGTVWTDLSGLGNSGTLYGGVSYNSTNGGYLNFDGSNDYAVIPNKLSGTNGTVSFFMKDNTPGGSSDIFTLDTGVDSTASRVEYDTTNHNYRWYGQGGFSSWVIIFNHDGSQWDYIALTFDGTTARSYKNGVLVYQSAISGSFPVATNMNIGRRLTWSYWKGSIANFAVYNRALSIDEINQNFNFLRGRYGV